MTTPSSPTTEPLEDGMTTTDPTIDLPLDGDLDAPDTGGFVQLDPDDLACRECGVTVPGPLDPAEVMQVEPDRVERLPPPRNQGGWDWRQPEPMSVCAACAARTAHAADLATTLLPRGIAVDGFRLMGAQAAGAVAATLRALAALGKPLPSTGSITAAELTMAVRRLAEPGARLPWSRRFAPVRLADARPDQAAPYPWAHLSAETREGLRRAYVHFVADRLSLDQPDVALPPPPFAARRNGLGVPSGCLICGVRVITRPAVVVARMGGRAEAARQVWTLRVAVEPHVLGGRRSPRTLTGHTCDLCTAAVEHVGALGIGSMERALMVELGLIGKWCEGADALEGVVAFGALVSDAVRLGKPVPAPNDEPWQHLGDLDRLRARIAPRLGAG